MILETHRQNSSLLKPLIIAFVVLAAVGVGLYFYTPRGTAEISFPKVVPYQAHTQFALDPNGVKVVGTKAGVEDDLYVIATVHIHNDLRIPMFLKDFTATLTGPDNTQYEASAIHENDLPVVFGIFPKVKELTGPLLRRETTIEPKQDVEGTILLLFNNATQKDWDERVSANLILATYHQDPITVEIPKK